MCKWMCIFIPFSVKHILLILSKDDSLSIIQFGNEDVWQWLKSIVVIVVMSDNIQQIVLKSSASFTPQGGV